MTLAIYSLMASRLESCAFCIQLLEPEKTLNDMQTTLTTKVHQRQRCPFNETCTRRMLCPSPSKIIIYARASPKVVNEGNLWSALALSPQIAHQTVYVRQIGSISDGRALNDLAPAIWIRQGRSLDGIENLVPHVYGGNRSIKETIDEFSCSEWGCDGEALATRA